MLDFGGEFFSEDVSSVICSVLSSFVADVPGEKKISIATPMETAESATLKIGKREKLLPKSVKSKNSKLIKSTTLP